MRPVAAPWIAALAMLSLALFAPGVLNDGDTPMHIGAGNWMIDHRAIPSVDPFSFTRAGAPWVAHEWLAELVMATAFRLAGWSGVLAATALAASLAVFNLARHLGRRLPAGATTVLLVLAAGCFTPDLLARPHILALPVFEAWTAGLFAARDENRPPPWRLLPLMVLWANLHGGFIIGLALVGPLAIEAALTQPARWRGIAVSWGGFLLAATCAALLTPHGLTGLIFPFQLARMDGLSDIGEWRPTDFGTLTVFELILVAGLYVTLSRPVRLPPTRIVILLVLMHMALQHTRHQMLVGVIVPLLLAGPFGAALATNDGSRARAWRIAGTLGIAALLVARLTVPVVASDSPSTPVSALAHVPPAFAQSPVFNEYDFGGFLIFAHVRPFIDGRADMYGSAFLREYEAVTRPDKAALEHVFAREHIAWTLLSPTNPAVALLDALPQWCRVYADTVAVVHAKGCTGTP